MGSFYVHRCRACSFEIVERTRIRTELADGRSGYRDERYCPGCKELRTTLREDPEAVDPALFQLRRGNRQRILSHLLKETLPFGGTASPKNWPPGIPRPPFLADVSRPLIAAGLVREVEGNLSLTEDGRLRLERLAGLEGPGSCPVCRRAFGLAGVSCPACGSASLEFGERGRCSDSSD